MIHSYVHDDPAYENRTRNVSDDPTVLRKEGSVMRKVRRHLDPLRDEIKLLYDLLHDVHHGRYNDASRTTVGLIIFALLYLLSPIDLIPDFIPVLGYADDVIVLTIIGSMIRRQLDSYKAWRDARYCDIDAEENDRDHG